MMLMPLPFETGIPLRQATRLIEPGMVTQSRNQTGGWVDAQGESIEPFHTQEGYSLSQLTGQVAKRALSILFAGIP